jgi:hypothetical protein
MTDTLKSICEQCVHLRNPRLEFIAKESQRQREIILRDLSELVSAASQELEKTVVILAGSLFESILYCFIQAQSPYIALRRGTFVFNPEHSLENYVEIFNRWFSRTLSIPDIVIDYRHIVHINRELKFGTDVCRSGAEEMLRLLNALLGEVALYPAP